MRVPVALALAATLAFSSAHAANVSVTPLPAGKPAGTKEAAMLGPNLFLIFISAGVLIGGLALAISNDNKNTVTSPTTSSTGTGA